ncbi:hypothetical protein N9195_01175 [bacterium]|nr:hypothetical protein [bacterium]
MNFKFRFASFALSVLPVAAGDDIMSSSKSGLYSAKGGLGSSKSGLDSSKSGLDSSKSGLDSSKSGLDSSKGGLDSSKGVIDQIQPAPTSTSRWIFGAGISWRKIGAIDFDTGASGLTAPGVFGDNSFTPPPGIGAATGAIPRTYDNGFVNPGPRTPATGRTSDYSYQTQDQVQGNELVMSATGGERRVIDQTTASSPTGWSEGDDWEISPYLSLSRLSDIGNGWSVGPALNFSFTDIGGSQGGLNTLNASESRNIFDVRAIDRFDSTGLVLPNAPYTGSPGAIAPLLPAEPAGRTFEDTLRSTDTAFFNDSVNESLDVNLFGFSLGASAIYQTEGRFFAGVGTGLVLNIADWDASRSDQLVQITNGGAPVQISSAGFQDSGTDVLFGYYLQGSVGYRINESWSVEANARYDWNESLRDSVGGSDFDVDLTGFTLGVGANYSF